MAFVFALAPLFRLRQAVERQRALALQGAVSEIARARAMAAQLDQSLADSRNADSDALTAGRVAAEIHFAALLRERMKELQGRLQEEVVRLESAREKAAAAYHQAFREREVLESLRARQRREYEEEHLRREQQRLDVAYLLQRWHRRNG